MSSELNFLRPPVFHLYNRANDRKTLFVNAWYYGYFLGKLATIFRGAARLLGYCIMPNHFHLLLTPLHPIRVPLRFDDKVMKCMPTLELSDAVQRTLMGFSKGYNAKLHLTGSRFQQHTRCKHHYKSFHYGLRYVHNNPVAAQLVDHPSEWPYSSYNEYAGLIQAPDGLCDVALGRTLLRLDHGAQNPGSRDVPQ